MNMIDYLITEGHRPVNVSDRSALFYSPFREERTPSFSVKWDQAKNSYFFKDFGDNTKKAGDIINLVRRLKNVSTKEALHILATIHLTTSDFFTSYEPDTKLNRNDKTTNPFNKTQISPITSPQIIAYLSWRMITPNVWRHVPELKQASYSVQNRHTKKWLEIFNLAWQMDNGSYVLRGIGDKQKKRKFVRNLGPSWITTIEGKKQDLNIFEGFFDYLSCLQYYNTTKLKNTSIILNSLSNIKLAMPAIEEAEIVNLFLDNDPAGIGAAENLYKKTGKCINKSLDIFPHIRPPLGKDFNNFLLNLKQ